jgi:hypothetical protein
MRRCARVGAGLLTATVLLVAGASAAAQDAGTPPTLLEPTVGAVVTTGTRLVFRIATFPGDETRYLWLYVSRSPNAVNACGTIAHDAEIEPFVATSDGSVYEATPTFFDYSGFWMNTPGTYYWQAYRIHYGGGADGCIESEVRSFQIVPGGTTPTPTTPTPTTPTPTTPTPPAPAPKPKAPLPLASARLAGDFDLKLRLTSVSGIGDLKRGDVEEMEWTLRPSCTTGACSVRLQLPRTLFGGKASTIGLRKLGARYTGTGTAYFARCSMTPVGGKTSVDLRVTAGSWIDGRWRATRVTGTVRYAAPMTTTGIWRCKAASLGGTVRGTLELGY